MVVEKNKKDWNDYAGKWGSYNHSEPILRPVLERPERAFHGTVWGQLCRLFPGFEGKKICVPSSGDNLAVFAFAKLGAQVLSCDIAENQLENARKVALREGLAGQITFLCADTMKLEGVGNGEYDLVYTSNGVHVWLDDLPGMYRNVYRVLKPGGKNVVYEVHPFQRPFGEGLKLVRPYDAVGPFEDEATVNFHWRMQDFLNAILGAGLRLEHVEEMFDEKNYDAPFFLKTADIIGGKRASREEVDRMYDWRQNPAMGLPAWMCLVSEKE